MEKPTGDKKTLVRADSPDDRQATEGRAEKTLIGKDNPDDFQTRKNKTSRSH